VHVQHLCRRNREVHPPQPERQSSARNRNQRGVQSPPLGFDHRAKRGYGADYTLAKSDDRQQAVTLRDVVCVPWGPALAALGNDRARQLDHE
jgi:hypothetical protein